MPWVVESKNGVWGIRDLETIEIAEVRLDGMSLAVACPGDKTYS